MPDEKDISRRRFLQYTGLVTGAAAALGLSPVSLAAERTGGQAARISAACRTGVPYKGVLWMYEEEAKRAK